MIILNTCPPETLFFPKTQIFLCKSLAANKKLNMLESFLNRLEILFCICMQCTDVKEKKFLNIILKENNTNLSVDFTKETRSCLSLIIV